MSQVMSFLRRNPSLTFSGALLVFWLDRRTKIEQNVNNPKQEGHMTDFVQDVVSMVCMGTFLVTAALWIGAL